MWERKESNGEKESVNRGAIIGPNDPKYGRLR